MKNVGFIYDDIFLLHEMPSGHPESKDRLIAINTSLNQSGIRSKLVHIKPRKAAMQDILAVHTKFYFEKVMNFTGYYDSDTYISETR
jgi:acetoin utilization deacetylase AcuC-like enzyme